MELSNDDIEASINKLWEDPIPPTADDMSYMIFIARTFIEAGQPDPIQNAVIALTTEVGPIVSNT